MSQRANDQDRPRLHWCPVGEFTFLPLHAAGIYTGEDQVCISDFVVSSYTPSLSSLIQARKNFEPVQLSELKALLIAEPAAANHTPLLEVKREVEVVSTLLEAVRIQHCVNMAPTVEAVLDSLPNAHFVHMVCHGLQQPEALKSYFTLHDGQLSIAALTKVQLPNALLAFLSACETAKGDQHQPDQAVHLAASMLFCGFRSVIGTMW
jgi:CHAT domain-containing protein